MKLRRSVETTSSTLSLTLRSAGSSAQSAPKIAAPTIISGTRLKAGSHSALADEAGGDGAGHELALGADVPEFGAEGDDDGKAGEEQRRGFDQRVLRCRSVVWKVERSRSE